MWQSWWDSVLSSIFWLSFCFAPWASCFDVFSQMLASFISCTNPLSLLCCPLDIRINYTVVDRRVIAQNVLLNEVMQWAQQRTANSAIQGSFSWQMTEKWYSFHFPVLLWRTFPKGVGYFLYLIGILGHYQKGNIFIFTGAHTGRKNRICSRLMYPLLYIGWAHVHRCLAPRYAWFIAVHSVLSTIQAHLNSYAESLTQADLESPSVREFREAWPQRYVELCKFHLSVLIDLPSNFFEESPTCAQLNRTPPRPKEDVGGVVVSCLSPDPVPARKRATRPWQRFRHLPLNDQESTHSVNGEQFLVYPEVRAYHTVRQRSTKHYLFASRSLNCEQRVLI